MSTTTLPPIACLGCGRDGVIVCGDCAAVVKHAGDHTGGCECRDCAVWTRIDDIRDRINAVWDAQYKR